MQTLQLLAAKTVIPPGTAKVSNIFCKFNQPETKGSVINTLNTQVFSTMETPAMQTQFYKLWVQSHDSGVRQLPLCKLSFTSFGYSPMILLSVSFRVRFPVTLDQGSDSKYVTLKKMNYSSGSFQLIVGTSQETLNQ